MPREVSRRTSKPPEQKGKVSRPDIPGKRDLDPKIVRDVSDPFIVAKGGEVEFSEASDPDNFEAIQRGRDMDNYFEQLGPMTEGKSK